MKNIRCICLLAGIIQFSFLAAVQAGPLDNWTTNLVTSNSFALKHIVYGNGCYVAIGDQGDAGAIYSSADGLNWVLRYSDNNAWGLDMSYDGHFAGAGGWETAISSNGTNWTVLSYPQGDLGQNGSGVCDMIWGNNLYVKVDSTNGTGRIMTTTDGIIWTSRTASPAIGGPISSITYGASTFAAVGNNDGAEYTSTTGSTWTRRTIAGGNKISFANNLFLVPVTTNANLISTDGINWSQQPTGLTNQLVKIVYSHGVYLSAAGRHLATSTDGTNWSQYSELLPGVPFMTNFDNPFATDGSRLVTLDYTNNFPTDLFFFGRIFTSEVLVDVVARTNPGLTLSGLIGRNYQIQSLNNLSSGAGWQTNASFQLTNTPSIWTDTNPPAATMFYRGVLMP